MIDREGGVRVLKIIVSFVLCVVFVFTTVFPAVELNRISDMRIMMSQRSQEEEIQTPRYKDAILITALVVSAGLCMVSLFFLLQFISEYLEAV